MSQQASNVQALLQVLDKEVARTAATREVELRALFLAGVSDAMDEVQRGKADREELLNLSVLSFILRAHSARFTPREVEGFLNVFVRRTDYDLDALPGL